jgi:ribonuclease T2
MCGFLSASIGNAQAAQCRMPQMTAVPDIRQNGQTRRMPVTGYTLALSWSPEFCKTRQNAQRHRMQCSGQNGRFGFIVHGLWPNSGKSWPQWCQTAQQRRSNPLRSAEIRRNLCAMPSAALIARQWVKHGSCMTKRPETYFKVTRILYGSMRFPGTERLSRTPKLTAGDVRQWFVAANSGWRRDAVGIKLSRDGWLQELRLCYGVRFRPTPCDRTRFGPRDNAGIKIWRGR